MTNAGLWNTLFERCLALLHDSSSAFPYMYVTSLRTNSKYIFHVLLFLRHFILLFIQCSRTSLGLAASE